jgi:predicted TIM-barrel fold metal-dependent hydrolase
MFFHQLPDLVALAQAFPGIPMVAGHFGGLIGVGRYADRKAWLPQWQRNIAALARCPNVVMKLGGVGIARVGFDWHKRARPAGSEEVADAFRPYVIECIEQFGPERCLFESNFPVDKRALPYTVIWNAFKRITKGFSPSEREALFRGTAERVYRIAG